MRTEEFLALGIAILVAFLVGYGCSSIRDEFGHGHMGRKGGPCFANKTCRWEYGLRCADDGSVSGVCVPK